MGLSLMNMLGLSSSVHTAYIACYWKLFLHYTQVLCQSRLSRADQSQSQSYFTTGDLPSITSSWRQAPWDPRPVFENLQKTRSWFILIIMLTLVPRSRIFLPWRWRRYVHPKRRLIQDLHGGTSKKTTFFMVTAVKISNLTRFSHISVLFA
jgi:hypothetical protein